METINLGQTEDYVYDISLDGTVVNALGMCVVHNTDGFNFKVPDTYEFTDEHPYISKGLGRNYPKGNAYTGVDADIAEFEDLFLTQERANYLNKMGLGLDEWISSSHNSSRKNYCDLFPDGKIKLVGNTIKSKKMPTYIERFINDNIRLIMTDKGYEFINNYSKYLSDIFNLRIPLRDIASKGKIKKTLEEYKEDCSKLTAAGTKKSRQAWYELAIQKNLKVDLGETIYYINVGKKKGHADVKRITHYKTMDNDKNELVEITKDVDKKWKEYRKECKENGKEIAFKTKIEYARSVYPNTIIEEDELIMNCVLLNRELIDAENDTFCDDETEYNVEKYIDQFNKRIKPLLVCFHPDIRDKILVTNPDKMQYFTEEQCKLVSGYPMKPTDQDTYEQLMTMEDKEIKFWLSINEVPPFVEEIGMDWEKITADYKARMKKLEEDGIREEKEKYNNILNKMSTDDLTDFVDNGKLPKSLSSFASVDVRGVDIISEKYKVKLGDIYDIIDRKYVDKNLLSKSDIEYERVSSSIVKDPESEDKMSDVNELVNFNNSTNSKGDDDEEEETDSESDGE